MAAPPKITGGVRSGSTIRAISRPPRREARAIAAAQGHFVHVYVDRLARRPVPLPAPLRSALEPLRVGAT